MLKRNILPRSIKRRNTYRIISILAIVIVIFYGINPIFNTKVYATQTRENYSTKINNYPGYAQLIESLKAKYPNWNFTILYTGLDWSQVLKNETTAYHGRSLISSSKSGYWFCSTCGSKAYDNGSWKCASEAAVAYYMDPRNWINEDNIFQFEDLSYNSSVQNINGVNQILSGTWMAGNNITYIDTNGRTQTINKSYAQVIMESAASAGISPYHLAARIRQEQGTGSASSTGCGTYEGYTGYYNLLNIKASGSGSATIITNALNYAKTRGWTTPESAILGGSKFLATEYISVGQSTLYLQKFDVDNTDGNLYYHQYMQNIEATKSEGNDVKTSYSNMGLLNSNINFVIPVYENMPNEISAIPGSQNIVTQNVEVTGIGVAVRKGTGTSAELITRLNVGEKLLRIEIATSLTDGYYWDKVVLSDGTKGYIARTFINQVADITNANDTAVTNTGVNLRNGPGTSGTTVLVTLAKGQALTVMENGKYNGLDGYNWSRIVLTDGTQGYLVSDYITLVSNSSSSTSYKMATLNGNKVRLRSGIGKSSSILTTLYLGDVVTIIQENVGTANGYTWDKVVTSSGLEGYVVSQYLTISGTTSSNTNTTTNTTTSTSSCKIEGNNAICIPNATVSTLKTLGSGTVVTKNGTTLGDNELVGTGAVLTIGSSTYTVVKKGDVNGDGKIKATDYMRIKNYIMSSTTLSEAEKKAADANSDGSVKATDYMKIKNYIMGSSSITL